MRTIIAGSRDITDYNTVQSAIANVDWIITEVVSGTARGVDRLGERWARESGIPITQFPAQWKLYGRSAGYRRNEEMAKYADALVAIWDGESTGTKSMIDLARKHNLKIAVINVGVCT